MTYICINITYYRNGSTSTYFYRHELDTPEAETRFDELSANEANKLMWELIKLGGKNEYYSNMFNNAISYRRVTYYGEL